MTRAKNRLKFMTTV